MATTAATESSETTSPLVPCRAPLSRNEAQQPVLLSAEVAAVNGARNIALADGLWRDGALGFDRVFFFFDGGQVEAARQSWRDLQGCEGVETRYWKQDARGKWVQGP